MVMFPRSQQVKHVIRPDGTIRVATKAAVGVEEGEIVVTGEHRAPGEWFYDFKLEQLVKYTPAQLGQRRQAKDVAEARLRSEKRWKQQRLQHLIQHASPDVREALELIADLSGVQAKKEPEAAPDAPEGVDATPR